MKNLSLVVAALVFGMVSMACGGADSRGSDDEAGEALVGSRVSSILFRSDSRPVDGALVEVRLDRNEDGTYDVTRHTNFYARIEGREVDSVTKVASRLHCSSLKSNVRCKRDERPVDGNLDELTILKNADGTYDANLHTEWSGFGGSAGSKDTDLGTGLSRQAAPAQQASILFSRDERPVDGALTEVRLDENENGTYDVTLHTNVYDRIAGHEVDSSKKVASGLSCSSTAPEVRCRVDRRPVDGDLDELTILQNANGTYDAKLHVEPSGFGNDPTPFDTVLGTNLQRRDAN